MLRGGWVGFGGGCGRGRGVDFGVGKSLQKRVEATGLMLDAQNGGVGVLVRVWIVLIGVGVDDWVWLLHLHVGPSKIAGTPLVEVACPRSRWCRCMSHSSGDGYAPAASFVLGFVDSGGHRPELKNVWLEGTS